MQPQGHALWQNAAGAVQAVPPHTRTHSPLFHTPLRSHRLIWQSLPLNCVQEGGAPQGTYSHLIKPALNSAATPFSFGDAEEWDPALTLSWSNRGIGSAKMGALRDTLLANTHLTGVKMAGENITLWGRGGTIPFWPPLPAAAHTHVTHLSSCVVFREQPRQRVRE